MIHSVIGIVMLGIIVCHGSCTPEPHTVQELEEPVVSVAEETHQEDADLESVIKDDGSADSQETEDLPVSENSEESLPDESDTLNEKNQSESSRTPDPEPERPSEQESNVTSETETEESEDSPEQSEESKTKTEDPTPAKESEHVHEWIPITEIIHHDAVYETVPVYEEQQILDAEAWDEEVPTGKAIYSCLGCDYETFDFQELLEHCIDNDHSYWCRPLMETIHHEAEYHTEKVKVGEERILVTEAWDEEIITGYQCSECGKVK